MSKTAFFLVLYIFFTSTYAFAIDCEDLSVIKSRMTVSFWQDLNSPQEEQFFTFFLYVPKHVARGESHYHSETDNTPLIYTISRLSLKILETHFEPDAQTGFYFKIRGTQKQIHNLLTFIKNREKITGKPEFIKIMKSRVRDLKIPVPTRTDRVGLELWTESVLRKWIIDREITLRIKPEEINVHTLNTEVQQAVAQALKNAPLPLVFKIDPNVNAMRRLFVADRVRYALEQAGDIISVKFIFLNKQDYDAFVGIIPTYLKIEDAILLAEDQTFSATIETSTDNIRSIFDKIQRVATAKIEVFLSAE